ncbi:hypothetical protein NC651_006869 [Populus alba x Populus x berolinensis]|nr:hypothetical protein NC651_006869 [Populus alba x Populus x berolinensis]
MEHKSDAVIDIVSAVNNHHDGVPKTKKKKRRSAMHILRVAMYMLSLRSGKSKSVQTDVASKWKKYLSFMRPLHVHSNHQRIEATPAPVTSTEVDEESKVTPPAASVDVVEQHLEVFTPSYSPAPKSIASSSSGQASQYASAQNLLDLLIDTSDEDEDGDEDSYYDDKYGDETIDMKAEQFIAKFYGQMKLQHKSY